MVLKVFLNFFKYAFQGGYELGESIFQITKINVVYYFVMIYSGPKIE